MLSANVLHTPRLTFAMGEQGDFPALFAAVHSRFRTPYVSIVSFAALLMIFSIAGSYEWNAILSAISRLFIYASIAAALPVLRRKQPDADAFRLPAGMFFVVLALLFTGVLIVNIRLGGLMVLAVTFASGFPELALYLLDRAIPQYSASTGVIGGLLSPRWRFTE